MDLDEFQLLGPLGRGGMGAVYRGHDTVLDRPVAIKLIGRAAPAAALRDRFLIEARAIARLAHPNVVTIYRVGTTADGRPFLVQELIRGRSLDQLPRPLAWREVCGLALGIARGLEAAHRAGIVHRDVKPANVMVDERGVARLLDFGIATIDAIGDPERAAPATIGGTGDVAETAPAVSQDPPTETGSCGTVVPTPIGISGTPRYLAPERWAGAAATTASDLYALGVLAYELLAGAPPYPAADLAALQASVCAGGARPIGELVPELPPAFAASVMACLAIDPAARLGSAGELAHALEQIAGAVEVPAGNPYRGLRAFDAAHRGLFYGRGADAAAVIDRLRDEACVVVVGDSGIGKSSLLHAGVAPAVRGGALGDARRWRVVGREALRGPPPTPGDDEGVLVVVDALEELVTTTPAATARAEAAAFAALAAGVPGVRVLAAVRGDFLTQVAALPALGAPLARGLHLLRVLAPRDLREAVVGPARAHGVRFASPALVDELVAAVADQPGALPLLQFTLAELWQARDVERAEIPASALAALGGVAGSLAAHADAAIRALAAEPRAAARRIALRLVSPAGTRAVVARGALVGDDPVAAAALEALVRGRLVVARDAIDGEPHYELAHEALLRSWGTLRDWLADAAGRRAAHDRLAAAAAAWDRLARRRDLLWTRAQLAETRALTDLAPRERQFLAASRRRARIHLAELIAGALAVPALALAVWLGARHTATADRARAVATRLDRAAIHATRADHAAAAATAARVAAFAAFAADDTPAGEARWTEVRGLAASADDAYADATAELEAVHLIEPGTANARMATVLAAHARLAEAQRDAPRLADLLRRLAAYDPAAARAWSAPAHYALDLDRPADIVVTSPGRGEPLNRTTGTALALTLAPGGYLVTLTTSDGLVVRHPLLLERGERLAQRIALPPASQIPAGMVYLPGNRFLFGSGGDERTRREFLKTTPLHRIETDAFLIGRTEVTYAAWIEYLDALPLVDRAAAGPGGGVSLAAGATGPSLTLATASNVTYRAAWGEPIAYRGRHTSAQQRWSRLPVSGISWLDAARYLAWLDRSDRVPGARACTSREWEYAARGADGRAYPHGDELRPSDANFDATYGFVGEAYGPDEVATHPASNSVFGIADLAGNVFEWVRGVGGAPRLRGGSFYQGAVSALASFVAVGEPAQRGVRIGLRVCATPR